MNNLQIYLVQSTFEKVALNADTAACLFFYRLFDLDPAMRGMFPADLTGQCRKMMQTIALLVRDLDRLDQLLPMVEGFSRTHAEHCTRLEHYDAVATSLRWTLEQVLGDAFTPEVEDAWLAGFTLIATSMQTAANRELEEVSLV